MDVLSYTREPGEDMIYASRLAYSMHLAYREGEKFVPFHHNEGILYAKATHNPDGTMNAKSLRSPWIFERGSVGYGVAAIRLEADGEADPESEGCVLVFESGDLVHFDEIGLFRLQEGGHIREVRCRFDEEQKSYRFLWKNENGTWMEGEGDPFAEKQIRNQSVVGDVVISFPAAEAAAASGADMERIEPGNILEIPDSVGDYMKQKLCQGYGTDSALADDSRPMCFPFPFAVNRADPCCMYWHGKYYYVATNDADENHTLYIRCSETLEGIISAAEVLLLDSDTWPGIAGLLWAPEFHEIGGSLYIFHAATSGEFFYEESRVMKLRDGGDPMCREDWSAPRLVVRKDGTPLCQEGRVISLDMTSFVYKERVYAMWSQRQFLPVDQGAWLYVAEINEREPWKLESDPVCIAKPEYGWENNHTFVVEGPYALWHDGKLMVTYSGAAVDATYSVGLLVPRMGSDILDPVNWRKSNYPLLSSRSVPGEYGPGHNSFMEDEDGTLWNFYHARAGLDAPRSSGARRVYFDVDGEPVLDVVV